MTVESEVLFFPFGIKSSTNPSNRGKIGLGPKKFHHAPSACNFTMLPRNQKDSNGIKRIHTDSYRFKQIPHISHAQKLNNWLLRTFKQIRHASHC